MAVERAGVGVSQYTYICLSTDTLPTTNVNLGSTAKELDTGSEFIFGNGAWYNSSTGAAR